MNVEVQEQIRAKAQAELALEESQSSRTSNPAATKELVKLEKTISEKEHSLAALEAKRIEAQADLSRYKLEVARLEAERSVILGKAGRRLQFKTAAERDKWLKAQINTLQQTLHVTQQQMQQLQEDLGADEAQLKTVLERKLTSSSSTIGIKPRDQDAIKAAQEALDAAYEQRKSLWRQENKLTASVEHAKSQAEGSYRAILGSGMDRATAQALQALPELTERLGLQGRVLGPLFTLFKCEPEVYAAVDAIAGQSLFHVVVEDDECASRLIDVLGRERLGRVTFIPLNRLPQRFSRRRDYPVIRGAGEAAGEDDDEPLAVPLIDMLDITEEDVQKRVFPALNQVRNKTTDN